MRIAGFAERKCQLITGQDRGRYDRPWGPERPIFGVIRYMTSENTARKVGVKQYLARYGAAPGEARKLF